VVVLLGAAGWVVSCFLPLYRIHDIQNARITLYRQIAFGSSGMRLGGILYLFGGIVAIGVFSIIGLRMRQPWNVAVLAGAVVAWSLVSTGVLVTLGAGVSEFNQGFVLGVGYWCLWASVICVVAGTITLVISLRHPKTQAREVAPQETQILNPRDR
jgi:hypothetical protein